MPDAPNISLPENLPQAHALILQLQEKLQVMEWKLKQFEKLVHGASADRLPEQQYTNEQNLLTILPPPSEPPATQDVLIPQEGDQQQEKQPPQRPARNPQPGVLETETQRIEPEEKVCPHCGQAKCEIGCERSERYEYVPAKIIRQEILRPKLACSCGQGSVSIAPAPAAVVEKGLPGPGLVSQVILSKYDDHIPLTRQSKQFERLGVYFPKQTLCGWVEKGADLLQPIVRLIKADLLAGDYLQADETPIRVMDPDVMGRCATGYLWVAARPKGNVLFEFHPGRNKEFAKSLIGNFQGILQTDGYEVYSSLIKERPSQLTHVGCLAHVRRKFVDAYEDQPKEAKWFVDQIQKIYLVEKHAREEELLPEQRLALRNQWAPPIWDAIQQRLFELEPRLLPKSPLGTAVRYALHQWEGFKVTLQDGRIEVDNNLTENSIRPSAVGKKNYLFIGHPDAGWRSAVIYTIIGSCRRHGIDPWTYMKEVFTRLPAATTKDLPQFLPAKWKELHAVKEQRTAPG